MKFLNLLLILIIVPLAAAVPELPHQFYGSVSDDNGLLLSGTLTARFSDKEFTTQIENGEYGLSEPFLIAREEGSETKIEFYINSNKVYDYIYESGAYTELNLYVSSSTSDEDSSSSDDSNTGTRYYDIKKITKEPEVARKEPKSKETETGKSQDAINEQQGDLGEITGAVIGSSWLDFLQVTFLTLFTIVAITGLAWLVLKRRIRF